MIITQLIIHTKASTTVLSAAKIGLAPSPLTLVSAIPKKILKTKICKMLPPFSDSNTLVGIMPIKVSITPGNAPCSLVTSIKSGLLWAVKSTPAPGWNRLPITNASTTAMPDVTIKKPKVPMPILPADGLSPKLAAPLMIETNTSGITSILIKWIKMVPSGANTLALSPMIKPTSAPIIMAITTCTPMLPNKLLLFILAKLPSCRSILCHVGDLNLDAVNLSD